MLDNHKLIMLVSRCPSLWDRNDEKFRDQEFKASLWNKIAQEMSSTGAACKDVFKLLREKYIREKEKQYGSNWELLEAMQFLDPHIILRKDLNHSYIPAERMVTLKTDPYGLVNEDFEEGPSSESEAGSYMGQELSSYNSLDFSRALIKMVYNSPALWDRSNKDHHDRTTKDQLWKIIARNLKTDVGICTLRWKGLREKYIRQKQKYNEGLGKWELLDDMSFLDSVIQYRKRHWQTEDNSNVFAVNESSCTPSHPSSDYDNSVSVNTYTNSTHHPISSQTMSTNQTTRPNMPPDSTLDVTRQDNIKRICSGENGLSPYKMQRHDQERDMRQPEQIFGELVAAMLSSKSEKEKHSAMMEIMSILTRPSS